MDDKKLTQWLLILTGVAENITPKIARPAADFIFAVSQNITNQIESEWDKAFFLPKILPAIKKIQPILQDENFDAASIFCDTYKKDVWENIILKIENIQDETCENLCRVFVLSLKNELFDEGEEYLKAPVLFTPFCRAETAAKVFFAIKKAKPQKLYIFSDGPRENMEGERQKVENLRKKIVEGVDWDCEVFTKFQDENLGARFGIEAAIDWFFENEEMGIILEDDCLPAPDFFRFCSELLVKYKDEEKIFYINGTNGYADELSSNSFSFKRITDFTEDVVGIWGWATWRRAWLKHDKTMDFKKYEYVFETDSDKLNFEDYLKVARMKSQINQMRAILAGANNTWDIQLRFSVLVNDGLIIVPDCNLVTNIGCGGYSGENAHATSEYSPAAAIAAGKFFFPTVSPKKISARPLSAKEYLQAAASAFGEEEIWEKELLYTKTAALLRTALNSSEIEEAQKNKILKAAFGRNVRGLIEECVKNACFPKAQKYLHLALSKGGFCAEKNFCANCGHRDCLLRCPTESIKSSKNESGEFTVNIDRNSCIYCWKCMRACRLVNWDAGRNPKGLPRGAESEKI